MSIHCGEHSKMDTDLEPDMIPGCHKTKGLNPIVQNRIKGAMYCGKRGGLSFEETVRPIKNEDSGEL